VGTPRVTPGDIFAALNAVYRRCVAATPWWRWSSVTASSVSATRTASAARARSQDSNKHPEWMLASESVALTGNGFKFIRDIGPGEAVFIDEQGACSHSSSCTVRQTPCIFEYVYFARPTRSWTTSRSTARACAWRQARREDRAPGDEPRHRRGHPDSRYSRTSALQLAQRLGLKYREGFIKNRYIGRTFIMRAAAAREIRAPQAERHRSRVPRKNVLLVDDSIVAAPRRHRSSTRARGRCTQVYFASAARRCASQRVRHRHAGASELVAAPARMRKWRRSSAPTGSSTRTSMISSPLPSR